MSDAIGLRALRRARLSTQGRVCHAGDLNIFFALRLSDISLERRQLLEGLPTNN